ncbi:hypothetical protein R6Q59_004694 [Mikania micrantha]
MDVTGGEARQRCCCERNEVRRLVMSPEKRVRRRWYNRNNPNRTVVNPYIHFGQRSIWPRGLPLENVGEIEHEEHYNEVFSGSQFIQQGISNGLPDVDFVFYFTRKQNLVPFDIRFDQHVPKVALPQGVMVPVNYFNTLFHY